MIEQSLKIIRNSIFVITVATAAMIITAPGEASDTALANDGLANDGQLAGKLGAFSGLATTPDYNAALVQTHVSSGDRYRLNASIPVRDTRYTRSVLSVKFDQKNLLPLAAASRTLASTKGQNGLKKRNNIALDRDRSLLADYKLVKN